MKAVRGEEEEEEEEEVEEAPLGEGTAPQKPDFSDFFRAPAGDGIPAKNHDDEDEERVSGSVSSLILQLCVPPTPKVERSRGEEGGGRLRRGGGGLSRNWTVGREGADRLRHSAAG